MDVATGDARQLGYARSGPGDRMDAGVLLLAAAATAIMLQATRVFLSYMVFIIDQAERVELGVTAGGVYVAVGLGSIVARLGRVERMVPFLVAGLVTTRLILQFWTFPEARMWLAAATVVLAGWLLPLLLTLARPAAAYGAGVGLALDVTFRIGRNSLDLALIPSPAAHAVTIALGGVAVLGAAMVARGKGHERSGGLAVSALAFGPVLALHHLAIGNLGAVQLRLDLGMDASAWSLVIGLTIGLALAAAAMAATNRWTPPVLAAFGALGLTIFWSDAAGIGVAGLIAGTAATMGLFIVALRGGSGAGTAWATSLWLTLGLLIHAVLLFAYFTATGWPLLIAILYAVLALVAFAAAWRPPATRTPGPEVLGGLAAAGAALLVAATFLTSTTSAPQAAEPLEGELTVMTYNIQSCFSVDNEWDLERTARVIENSEPDVILLQEVGRGWPILSGADQAAWLAHRLDMQLVWGPASQDDLWGNAILTKAPITSTAWVKYSTTENLRRGAVLARLETSAGQVTVISTHLDNPGSATSARQEQITQLLAFAEGEEPVIIAGDLNADPDSEAIMTIVAAGFTDTGSGLGAEAVTSDDGRRIDYVLISPELEVVDVEIPDTWASDHRPFVATLRLGP